MRLVDGPAQWQGRLEVFTTGAGSTTPYQSLQDGWYGFCDAGFSDSDAGVICRLMGKPFGRKLYAPKVNTRTTPITTGPTVNDYIGTRGMQDLRCATAGAGRHRLLLAEPLPPLTATINLPPQHAGTTCTMQSLGMCASPGPYAGVECSDTAFQPRSPPSPPRKRSPQVPAKARPPPPAPPPSKAYLIRFLGGPNAYTIVEANLCVDRNCPPGVGRVEVLVRHPANNLPVWTPLCFVRNKAAWMARVAQLACEQYYDWPASRDTRGIYAVSGVVYQPPFTIPAAGSNPFNPAAVEVWTTPAAQNVNVSAIQTIQDLPGLKTATTPCASGALMAVQCFIAMP